MTMQKAKCKDCGVRAATKGPGHSVFIGPYKQALYEGLMVVEEREDYLLVGVRLPKGTPPEERAKTIQELFKVEGLNYASLTCEHTWIPDEEQEAC